MIEQLTQFPPPMKEGLPIFYEEVSSRDANLELKLVKLCVLREE